MICPKKKFFYSFLIFLIFFAFSVKSASVGETLNFYVDSSYDSFGRKEVLGNLRKISAKLYIYVDNSWWESLSSEKKNLVDNQLSVLAEEFDSKIYPILTSTFGSEWRPGIDNDERITILFHPMRRKAGGYFNSGNEYSRFQNPLSNEREMLYLNTDYILDPNEKSFLAHEFTHLITFNQKEKIYGIEEAVWLNEARAEYAPTLLGYNDNYQGSNLQTRVIEFFKNPSNSITDWQGSSSDYGALNLFIHYLVDNYGIDILIDSLHSSKKGIESINYALEKNGFDDDFSQVFTNWTIAVLINDCSLNDKYCFKNKNLKNLRILPTINFLPRNTQSFLSVNLLLKNWSASWQKIVGGTEILKLKISGDINGRFKVPYILYSDSGIYSVKFLSLDENQRGEFTINDFDKYRYLVFVPSLQIKKENLEEFSPFFSFNWEVRMETKKEEEELIQQLLAQIEALKAEIARLKAEIARRLGEQNFSCQKIESNLYFGLRNDEEVRCLQVFLKNQGPEIYPEGLITGNFLSLTKKAVIRFQEKYANEILTPLGLQKGTGYVGPLTRAKINKMLVQ